MNRDRRVLYYAGAALALVIVVGAVVYAVKLANSGPLVAAILHSRPEDVVAIRLLPSRQGSLVKTPVEVADPHERRRILAALAQAERFFPNHPSANWCVVVEMQTKDRTIAFSVSHTQQPDNGTIIHIMTGVESGWNLGEYRADALALVLETIVAKAGQPSRADVGH